MDDCYLRPMHTEIIDSDAHSTRLSKLDEICTRCELMLSDRNACSQFDGTCPYDVLISVLNLGR